MIYYENEIKRMNTWEKVVQVSNQVGFVAPTVEQAKIEIAKGMATFGLALFRASEGTHKLVNIHDTNEYIEVAGETRDEVLLELFNVTIMQEAVKAKPVEEPKQEQAKGFTPKINIVNTPQEAVARANEVRSFTPNTKFDTVEYVNDIHRQLHQEIGTALRYAQLNGRVSSRRLGPIFRKIAVIGWEKQPFKLAINSLLGVNDFEKDMSNDQCTVLLDHLAVLESEVNKVNEVIKTNPKLVDTNLNEAVRQEMDGFNEWYKEEAEYPNEETAYYIEQLGDFLGQGDD